PIAVETTAATSRPSATRIALTYPNKGGCHAVDYSDRRSDSAAGRRRSELAVQPRLGLRPFRHSRDRADRDPDPGADRTGMTRRREDGRQRPENALARRTS